MKLNALKSLLRLHPDALSRFILPDGTAIPAHYHLTEVGHVSKRFIDCGGKVHERQDICLLQTWLGADFEHRLNASTFANILDLGRAVLPVGDIDVEVEFESALTAQYPIESARVVGEHLEFQLGIKHTACLARERRAANSPANYHDEEIAACC